MMTSFVFSYDLLPLAIPMVISGLLAIYTLRYHSTTGAKPFALMMASLFVWSASYLLVLAGTDLAAKSFWLVLTFVGVVLTPVFWLIFALDYTGRARWLPAWRIVLLFVLPAVNLLVIVTNPWHHLFWASQNIQPEGPYLPLVTTHGPWFWVHTGYSYVLLVVGTVFIVRALLRWPVQYRGQMAAVLLAMAAPWLANIASVFRFVTTQIDLTPFAFTISSLGLAFAVFRHHLLNLAPIARSLVIDGIRDGMVVLDIKRQIVDINPAARSMLALTGVQKIIGQSLDEILSGWPRVVEHFRQMQEGEDEISIGEGAARRWYELNFSPLRNKGMEFVGQVIIARDVTERKRTDEQIRLQAVALASTANSIVISDTNGVILWINPAFTSLTGYAEAEAIGKTTNLLKSGKHGREFYRSLWSALQAGEVWRGEVINRRKDGSLYVEEQTITPVRNEQDEIFRYIAVKQDITERKHAEERIDQLLRQQEIILENIPVGVLFQKEQNIIWANKAITEMSGYSTDEVKTLDALMDHETPNSLERFVTFIETELKNGTPASTEAPFRRKDGSIFWCDIIGQAINPRDIRGEGILWVAQDVTAKRQAEVQIRQLSRAVESSPASIVITDRNGKIQYVNPKYTQVTGYTLEETLGENPRILKTENTPAETHRQLWQAISAGQEWRGEFCNRKKNGELYWELASISPITNTAGEITHYVAVKEDITEQREVREQLRLQSLQQQAISSLLRLGFESDSLEGILHSALNEILVIPWLAFQAQGGIFLMDNQAGSLALKAQHNLHPDVQKMCALVPLGRCLCGRAALSGKTEFASCVDDRYENTYPDMDNHGHYSVPILRGQQVLGAMVFYLPSGHQKSEQEQGFLEEVADVLAGIIERKHVEALLSENETRFRQIVENASDIIYRTNLDGLFTYSNPTTWRTAGFKSEDEMLGRHFLELVQPEWRSRLNRFYVAQSKRRTPSTYFEFPIIGRDGHEIWLGQNVQIINEGEKIVGFQALARDITNLKKTQEALALSRDQALEASRLKSQLLAKVSHELRTPLGGIIGYAELLQIDTFGPLNAEQRQAAIQIIESADYLDGMINELLDEAQIESRTISFRREAFWPANLLEKVQASMSVLARRKGLDFSAHLAPEVPEKLLGDENRLRQIFLNLTGNAIKYTRQGQVKISIYCPNPTHWAIQVEDTGAGIPKEALAQIFEPFHQVDNSITRENRGTGLGLSITKQLVELMDGQITVQSEVDAGSTFTVTLPLHTALASQH